MKLEFEPIKNQKFEIGRTINPIRCDCEECDFMNCPKHNYAVKMKRKKYTVDVFWDEWKEKILNLNKPKIWQYSFHNMYDFLLTYDMITDLFDVLCFSFQKGTYWEPTAQKSYDGKIEECVYGCISLVKFSRSGKEIELGCVEIANHKIHDYDLNERQYRLAEKIRDSILWLKEKVFEYYQNQDKEWTIGWLSRDGRHYPCKWGEHCMLADKIGGGEFHLEHEGWVKVASEDDYGYFQNYFFGLSAEQKNWLSANGYSLDD